MGSERRCGNDPPRPLPLAEMLAAATARADEAERRVAGFDEFVRGLKAEHARHRDDLRAERDAARADLAAAEARERALREAIDLAAGRVWDIAGRDAWETGLAPIREALGLAAPAPPPGPCARAECVAIREALDDAVAVLVGTTAHVYADTSPDATDDSCHAECPACRSIERIRAALAQPAPSPGAAEAETCNRCHRPSDTLTTARGTHEAGPATTCAPVRLCPACVWALAGGPEPGSEHLPGCDHHLPDLAGGACSCGAAAETEAPDGR